MPVFEAMSNAAEKVSRAAYPAPPHTTRAPEPPPAACKKPDIQRRIIRAPLRRDGSAGLLYLRLRVEQADARLRPVRVDLPLCTASRDEAAARACVLVYTLRALGAGVIGDFPAPWLAG